MVPRRILELSIVIHLRRFRPLRYALLTVMSAFLVFLGVACSNVGSSSSSDDVLRVATSPDFPPFEFQADDGTLQGFDIDLMTAIAQTQNLSLEFEPMVYEDVIRSLLATSVDAAISGISITEERAETVSFSRPYFESGLAIAVASSSPDLTSADALSGKRIGIQRGTTGDDYAQTISGSTIKRFETIEDAFSQLSTGEVDAVINDYPVTQYNIRQGLLTNVKAVGDLLTQEYYGIALPKESQTLNVINTGLTTVIENGQYAEIYSKWFDSTPPALPESVPGAG